MEDGSDSDHDQAEQSVDNVSQEKSDVPQKPLTGKELLLQKFNALKSLKQDARKANQDDVVEEDRISKLPKNFEAKKRKAEWILNEEAAKKEAALKGQDYEQIKHLQTTAEAADRKERAKKKKNPDPGFSDYEAAHFRHYEGLIKDLKPNMGDYDQSMAKWGGDDFSANSLSFAQNDKVSKEGVDRLVADIKKQEEKRSQYSRRRAHHPDADIDYINERNMKFNKKLERFYGEHTKDLKQALERGTST